MRARTFRVPFGRVAPDAIELEWGPDDYVIIRPLLTKSPADLAVIFARLADEEDAKVVAIEILDECIVEWSLMGEDGRAIPKPATWDDIDALPSGLGGALVNFLYRYRGEAPDPTTAGQPS